MKKIIQLLLKIITTGIIHKYHPVIIGITGSVGKTSTKEAIYSSFSGAKKVRKSAGNLNTEIGAPLVFIGEKRAGRNAKEWFLILIKGFFLIIKRDKKYPEVIIVEMAADKPGDIEYLGSFIKPHISIITAVGESPVHVEFYKNSKDVAKEKEKIISATKKEGTVILNADDLYTSKMTTGDKKLVSFGFSKDSDVKIEKIKTKSTKGSVVVIRYKNKRFSLLLPGCVGNSFGYIAASVFAVGVTIDINPEKTIQLLKKIRPTKGRMYPIKGVKKSTILDGSYNASPASTISALKTLKEIKGKRKIAAIGDMLELGKYSADEHRRVGKLAAKSCDYLFLVGEWAHITKKAAIAEGMRRDKVFLFSKSSDATDKIEELISEKDVVLVKGSQSTRMEKIVYEIMQHQEKAKKLLVRQEDHWINKK